MIASKVIRKHRRHINRADYGDSKPLLSPENVLFPKIGSLQPRVLARQFPAGRTLSHRDFDAAASSYRLGSMIDQLRDKGWTIVNHDSVALTKDPVPRKATFTRYELFAEFSKELQDKIRKFCGAVEDFEARAVAAAQAKKQVSDSAKSTQPQL